MRGEQMAATIDIPAAGYRYVPYRLPVFRRRGGAGRLPDRAGGIRPPAAARRRLRLDRGLPGQAGRAARRLLRLRTALAGAIHRCRASSRSIATTPDAEALGRDEERQGQPGGAQQRHPAAAQAGRAELPRVLLCSSRRRRVRVLRHRRQRRGGRRSRPVPRAHGPLGRDEPGRDAREGGVRARAHGGAHGGAGQDLGRYHGDAGLHGA